MPPPLWNWNSGTSLTVNWPTVRSPVHWFAGGVGRPGNLVVSTSMIGEPVSTPSRPPGCPSMATSANTRFTPTRVGEGMPGIPIVVNPAPGAACGSSPQPTAKAVRTVKAIASRLRRLISRASTDCRPHATEVYKGTLNGFPPAMVRGEQSSPLHAIHVLLSTPFSGGIQ